jgi:LmbE family N-acetylglucosaminyl deacetylase
VARPQADGDLGTILAVFAHPDDEAYLAGALMATAVDAGRRVVCGTATRGELGFPDDDPRSHDERAAVRTAELAACLAELGVTEHRWLDLPDGGCAALDDAGPVGTLRALIDEVRPDVVLTFGPDGQTFHEDHISVGRWTTLAHREADHRSRLLYSTATPEWNAMAGEHVDVDLVMMVPGAEPPATPVDELAVWFTADGDLLDRKVRALQCQASQVGGFIAHVGPEVFREMARDEFYRDPTPADWPPGVA